MRLTANESGGGGMQETLFAVLKNTVNVLIVDDIPGIVCMIHESLKPYKIYSVHTASTTSEALDLLRKSKIRFHVCLFDLGLDDVDHNEFYLLDKYGAQMPFVIMSAQENTEKSFEAKKHGARAYIRKGNDDFMQKILKYCNQQALRSIVCPINSESPASPVFKYVEALINKKPNFVADWASEADITDRQLRCEWEEQVGFSPKHSLCMFHLFSKIFEKIEMSYESEMDPDQFFLKHGPQSLEESASCKRFLEYYLLNQNELMNSIHKNFSIAI
jgi:CheY-like chemotaxis protein